jgi:hypothetical protein
MSGAALSERQIERYARHILLPEIGGEGQRRLLAATVAVELGAARAAEVAALAYLAAAGVGRLVLGGDPAGAIGADEVRPGLLFGVADVGRARGEAARDRIAGINPAVEVVIGAGEGDRDRDGWVLAEEMGDRGSGMRDGGWGSGLAGALIEGGAAAARLITRIGVPR